MAQRGVRPDVVETDTMRSPRRMGSGTDVLSMSAKSAKATLPHAIPRPAYVSDSEAEKLVYAEIERPAKISAAALHLVNGFLDQILYDILSKAHSVSLGAVRSAVPMVLKQRLGHTALRAADEELQDYLDEDEMEEVKNTVGGLDPKAEFDVDLSWRLTRLRCMVYAKLGDMEEEDEEEYLDDDDLREQMARVKDSVRMAAAITPAAAIFLTTVLEFLGEQALCIAAQHAKKRQSANKTQIGAEAPVSPQISDQDVILLDEIDMSGIGKEGPLIRLWRSWKGSTRGGGSISSRPTTPLTMSPSATESPNYEWKFPPVPPFSTIHEERSPPILPASSPLPSDIPLPISDNDVEEIEGQGLTPGSHDEDGGRTLNRPTFERGRPSSMLIMPGKFPSASSPAPRPEQDGERRSWTRRRSNSLPTFPQPASGAQSTQEAQEAGFGTGEENALSTTKDSEGLGALASRSAENKTDSGPETNRISSTVATIAGALSVEAARVFHRDQPAGLHTSQRSDIAGRELSSTDNTTEDTETAAWEQGHDTATTPGGAHQANDDPEDLALSSGEENGLSDDEHAGLRDSGFGVAHEEQELLPHAHDQTAAPVEQSSMSADAPQSDIHEPETVQEQSASDESDSVTLGTAAIFYQGRLGSDVPQNVESVSNRRSQQQPKVSVPSVTRDSTDQEGAVVSSAWPAVIPGRASSLEGKASAQSNPQSQIPQHIPAQPQASKEKMASTVQDRAPRYATSSFATNDDGHDSVPASHAKNASAGRDGMPATAGRPHVRLRPDTDEGSWRITPPDEMDRAKKSLDVLIDSDETLHITLTPKTARPTNETPKVKSQTQELADFFRNTVPPGDEASRPRSSRSAKNSINGFRSTPQPQVPLPANVKPIPAQANGQQSASSPSRHKNPLGEPRDPRMAKSSTRDLADYARSTGPENEMQLPKPLTPRRGIAQGVGVSNGGATIPEGADDEGRPATTSGKPVHRLKYQARDARGPRTAESSDLIDFIREGPPRVPGDHRIDRNVAPFRTTMDSDDLNALAPPLEADSRGRSSVGSAQESSITIKSMPSSMNSRTGLLESTNRTSGKFPNGMGSSVQAVTRQPVIPEADGIPKRNRRKVRDPYAIDYSDEDEDLQETTAAQQQRAEEESLVDFLRNTAPPPGMTTQPILAAIPSPTKEEPPVTVKKSTSNSKLRDYFPGSSSNRADHATKSSNGPRAESPHLTQTGSKMDKYRPTQPTHAAHVERNRQKLRAEPRDATVANGGGTSDLAAYLKNSGPAPGTETPPHKFSLAGKDQAGFMRFFQKRGSVSK